MPVPDQAENERMWRTDWEERTGRAWPPPGGPVRSIRKNNVLSCSSPTDLHYWKNGYVPPPEFGNSAQGLHHANINLAMGYTHDWRGDKPRSDGKWQQIRAATSTILGWCQDQGLEFQFEHYGPHPAIVEYQCNECIVFSGSGTRNGKLLSSESSP
jgi:hypothetical protein